MSGQAEMFTPAQLRPPFYAEPLFVKMREIAVSKPNDHKAACRIRLGDERLLAAVREDGAVVAVAEALGVYWSEAFRDLLRARAKGLVDYVGGDRWVARAT